MASSELKGIPVAPLTGILDARSSPDALPAGALRYRQNFQVTDEQNKLRRGSGWAKFLTGMPYNNQDFHDQLLSLSDGIRQPPTLAFEASSSRGVRSLFIGTQSTIAQLNEYSGNWRIIGNGLGGDPITSGKARRFKSAQLGDYIAFTNDFDPPMYHILEQNPQDLTQTLSRFSDFELIGLSRARVVWEWHNCLFFADVEMDGERFASRLLWSNFKDPTSFDPAKLNSITGSKDLFQGEQILAGMPGLGGTFIIYTTKGMWEMSVVGGDQSFAFRRIYNGEENEGIAVLKYPNTLVSVEKGHIYCAEDGVYLFNQYSSRPERIEWLHRATSLIYKTIDTTACDAHIAAVVNDELLISVARVGAPNACPDITLRVNMTYQVVDVVDHGFTALCSYRSYRVPTIRDFIIENGICSLANLQSAGYGYGNEGLPAPLPTPSAAFTPASVYSSSSLTVGDSDALGTPKTVVEVSRASNVATAKVVAHGLSSLDEVQIIGVSDSSFNTAKSVITVTNADHFTYRNVGPDVSTTAAAVPTVRLIGNPADAVAIVAADHTVTVKMKGHGFITGQKVRVAGKISGNPAVNTALASITVLDVDTFTYPSTALITDTIFGAANIQNVIPELRTYDWTTSGTPHFDDDTTMQTGLIYWLVRGENDLKLHLPGPNLDISAGPFVYDGAGIDLIGNDNLHFSFNYTYDDATSTPPGVGDIRFNDADPTIAAHLYVRRVDGDDNDQSQKLRDLAATDLIKVSKESDPTIFHIVKITSISKQNNYIDFTITYVTGAGTLANNDAVVVSGIQTSKVGKLITAAIFTGLKVSVSTIGPTLTPTTVSRNDPDNPDVVTMALVAHGLVRNNLIWVDGIADASFDAFATKVVVIQNTEHPTFSVTDANHFTYVREGNPSDSKSVIGPTSRKITMETVDVEDYTQATADSDSLCALLGNARLDDICRTCSGPTLYVGASSQDWCLKQLGGVFYRERCANPTATGTTDSNGYTSAVGSYLLDGYDSILRFAPMFTTAPGQPSVEVSEFKVFFEAAAETPPKTIGLRVGIAGQPRDPNVDNCGIVWHQHSQKELKCLSNKTEAQHKATNTQPTDYASWAIYRVGRYLMMELKISGTGADCSFTGVVADAKAVDADNC